MIIKTDLTSYVGFNTGELSNTYPYSAVIVRDTGKEDMLVTVGIFESILDADQWCIDTINLMLALQRDDIEVVDDLDWNEAHEENKRLVDELAEAVHRESYLRLEK
jgi:hypothetical protein